MAGVQKPRDRVIIDPSSGRITLEFDAFLTLLLNALNAVSNGGLVTCASYTVATVPSASDQGAGKLIYVSDEAGGAVIAFSDGTDWRRVTDRTVIS